MKRPLLSTGPFWLLLVLGALLMAWGLERAHAPHPCDTGNSFYARGLYTQAEKAYLKVLTKDEASDCAADALAITQQQRCFLAKYQTDTEKRKAILASEVKDYGPICMEAAGSAAPSAPTKAGPWWNWEFNDLAWVLTLAGGALLLRQTRLFLLRRRPGAVSVTELVDATGMEKIQTKAYTAQLRERLGSRDVLPPAPVPGGVVPQSVIDAISTSPLSQAGAVAKAITAVTQLVWTSTAHEVSGTLHMGTYEPKFGITIQLADLGSGSTESVVTLWRSSHREAVRDAAFLIYDLLLSHPDILAATPVWQRWTASAGRGVSHFEGGRWEEALGNTDKAIEQYRLSSKADPRNAMVRLRLGTLLEAEGDVLGALEQYLTITLHWPELVIPSYRLAASYAAQSSLVKAWTSAGAERKQSLARLIDDVESTQPLPRTKPKKEIDVDALPRYFLERSIDRLDDLSYADIERGEGVRTGPMRRASRVARCVAAFQLAMLKDPPMSATELLHAFRKQCSIAESRLGWRADWMASYNYACLRSQGASFTPPDRTADSWKEDCARRATEILDKVIRDRACTLKLSWICEDPDLKPISETSTFKAWSHMLGCFEKTQREADVTERLGKLRTSWRVLSSWARDVPGVWASRLEELDDWNGVQFSEIEDWCELERVAWGRLAHWAGEPLDEGRRPEVWSAFRRAAGNDEPGEMKLPDVSADKLSADEKRPPDAEARELEALWGELHDLARTRSDCWEKRSRRADSGKVTMRDIENWSVQARDTWETLADSAVEPTERDVWQRLADLAGSCA